MVEDSDSDREMTQEEMRALRAQARAQWKEKAEMELVLRKEQEKAEVLAKELSVLHLQKDKQKGPQLGPEGMDDRSLPQS